MNIEELRERKSELQDRIYEEISRLTGDFKKDTGEFPSSISIDILDIRHMGEDCYKYARAIGRIVVDIKL